MPYAKGQSGNPKGRPKQTAEQKSPIHLKCRRTCEAGLNLSKRQGLPQNYHKKSSRSAIFALRTDEKR